MSNTILSPEEDEPRWYVPRLTDEQWREAYEKGYHLPIKKEEREKAEKDSIAALSWFKIFTLKRIREMHRM